MEKVIIIAEAGVNHNGDINVAKKLIDVAVYAGVDYVKFQTFKSESLVSKSAKKADYQVENTQDATENQFQMLKKLELSHQQHIELISYCEQKNICFFSTAFDLESLDYLKTLGFSTVKIPSGEITNLPYLRKAAELFSKVIISTGMSTLDEIENALNVFLSAGINREAIYILHCNTEYPTPMEDVNLLAMLAIKNKFNVIDNLEFPDHYKYTNYDIDKIVKLSNDINCKIVTTEKGEANITIVSSTGTTTSQIVPKGLTLLVKQGDVVKTEQPLNVDPNAGGFGQEETEIVLQKPARIIGYLAFCFCVLLTQILLILKKKQFEKVQAAELNF